MNGKHVISCSSQCLSFGSKWKSHEFCFRISWFHAFVRGNFSRKLIWPCTRHVRAVQRSNIHLHGYLMLFNHTIKMIVWSINMHTLQPTQENTAWTKQIEHCHSVAKHILRLHTHHKIYSCSAPTFQCNGKRQEREGISFIIIKIDVGHLMGKLLFHGEIANRTHQVKGKGRAITLTR